MSLHNMQPHLMMNTMNVKTCFLQAVTGPTCCLWAAHHRPLQTLYCRLPKYYLQDQLHNFLVQFHCKDNTSITNKTQTYSLTKSITIANRCLQVSKNGPQSFYQNVLCMLSVVVDKMYLVHPGLTIWITLYYAFHVTLNYTNL